MFKKNILLLFLITFLFPLVSAVEGDQITTSGAIINVGFLFILVIFFLGCVLGMRNTDKPWAVVGFLGFAHLTLLTIFFIAWSITEKFLLIDTFLSSFFKIGFFVLVIAFPLLIFCMIIWGIYMMITIKEIQNLIDKGIPEDQAYERKVRSGMGRKF